MNFILYHGDCLEQLKRLEDNSVDSVVSDPPYGLSFMGKKWDYDVPSVEVWAECLRVLKPGGHLLAFAGTRTQHRMAVRIEDAGFEIRDMIAWVYGSGFPKSLDVSKAIDKAAGAEREKVPASGGLHKNANLNDDGWSKIGSDAPMMDGNIPATEAAQQWQGWGTALKPALEPITVARKPLMGTVAENVLEHGTGGLNIDGCRVGTDVIKSNGEGAGGLQKGAKEHGARPYVNGLAHKSTPSEHIGRWPANLIHDGSDEVVGLFPESNSAKPREIPCLENGGTGSSYVMRGQKNSPQDYGDKGSAARFFYCAKASKRDRDEGLEGFDDKQAAGLPMRSADGERGGEGLDGTKTDRLTVRKNVHPTVKPTDLMRYLCRLVTPPGGIVLDPFMGSGSTGKAAVLEGFQFIGIERELEYVEIAKARIEAAKPEAEEPPQPGLFD
jgi:DNA modification methylase